MALPLGTLDWIGIVLFALATIGYHSAYIFYTRANPLSTVKGKIHLYRRTWVKRILDTSNQMLAVQTIRNLLMTSSFMASSALLVLAVLLNLIVQGGPSESLHVANAGIIRMQLFLLAGTFAFSFLTMLLSIRYLNQFVILIGADPDLIDHVEGVDAVTYLSNLINRASNRYTYGQRGFYFSLPLTAWVFSPIAFIVITAGILCYLLFYLDFKRWQPPKYLVKPAGAEDAAPPKA